MTPRQRTPSIRFAAVALSVAAVWPAVAGPLALAPGDPVPDLRGNNLRGERTVLEYGTHPLTLINFWATWCEPCKLEMPSLEELHHKHSAAGLRIVGVALDTATEEELIEFVDALGLTYEVIMPISRTRRNWGGLGSLPMTFMVDREGKIKRRYVGATPEQIEGMVYDVEEVLAGRPLGPFVFPAVPDIVTDDDRPTE